MQIDPETADITLKYGRTARLQSLIQCRFRSLEGTRKQ